MTTGDTGNDLIAPDAYYAGRDPCRSPLRMGPQPHADSDENAATRSASVMFAQTTNRRRSRHRMRLRSIQCSPVDGRSAPSGLRVGNRVTIRTDGLNTPAKNMDSETMVTRGCSGSQGNARYLYSCIGLPACFDSRNKPMHNRNAQAVNDTLELARRLHTHRLTPD
jgi:hypothetical protein